MNLGHSLALASYRITHPHLKNPTYVKPKIIPLDKKYWDKEHKKDDPDNDFPYTVRKQVGPYPRPVYPTPEEEYKEQWRTDAVVLEEYITNNLGMPDTIYHYLLYKPKLNTTWARSLGLKKYGFFSKGFYCPYYILKHIVDTQIEKFAYLIIATPNELDTSQTLFYKAPAKPLIQFFMDNKMPIIMNAYGQQMTAFPMQELFTLEK